MGIQDQAKKRSTNGQSLVKLDFLGIIVVILLVQQAWIPRSLETRFASTHLQFPLLEAQHLQTSIFYASFLISTVDGVSTCEELLQQKNT